MTFYNRNGMLYARVNGKRVSTKLKDTKENRKLFESYLKNNEFFKKFNIMQKIPTILELCEEVLSEKEVSLKQTSFTAYRSLYINNIVPFFDKKLVNEIRPKDIDSFYKTFKDLSTLNTCNAILKEVFNKAIIYEYIDTSPLIVKRPKFESNYEINPLSIEEINLILSKANKWFRNYLGVAFFTGMRPGEIAGLKWEDIDFNNFTISINRTITNGFVQTPKTKSSKRVIDMIPKVELFLLSQKKITGLSEYVFSSPTKERFNNSSSINTYHWYPLLEKLNIKKRSVYQTRHSFASNMLTNGEDLMWVSATLGHKSADITLKKYTKYIRRKNERKLTFLDDSSTKSAHIC